MTTSHKTLKNSLATLCVVGAFWVCSTAQAGWTIWTNSSGDGLWETAANWHAGLPDNNTQAPIIGDPAAGEVNASTGTYSIDYLRVGVESSYPTGVLNVSGATIRGGNANTRHGFGYGSGNSGTLNLSSGSLTFNNNTNGTSVGTNSGTGIVHQTGGTLSFSAGGSNSVTLGSTNGTGLYNFTAGALETRGAFNITTGGSGSSIFQINGYDAASSIQIGGTVADFDDGAWLQGAGTTLALALDGGTSQGTTRINVGLGDNAVDNTNDGMAVFDSGSFLDLDFNSGTQSGTWTILSAAGGIEDNGLALAPGVDTDIWSFAVVGNDLQVTAVIPEPASLALMLIVGGALLVTRRRKA